MSTPRSAEQAPPRDRLLAGMAESIREKGFRATTVTDVVGRARTSRRTFYEHFADREACFLALLGSMETGLHAVLAQAAAGDDPFEQRVDRTLTAWLQLVDANPELLRAALREAPGLGERGAAHLHAELERTAVLLVRLFEEAHDREPGVRPISIEEATVVAGGFRELIVMALDRGRPAIELHGTAAGLIRRIGAG